METVYKQRLGELVQETVSAFSIERKCNVAEDVEVKVQCSLCNDTFTMSEIKLERLIVNREKEYLITYFQCPRCLGYHMVMVQDEKALKAQKVFEDYKTKIKVLWNAGQRVSKTLIQNMQDAQARMKRQTKKLSFEFPQTFYQFDELKLENINKRPFTESKIGESEETDVN